MTKVPSRYLLPIALSAALGACANLDTDLGYHIINTQPYYWRLDLILYHRGDEIERYYVRDDRNSSPVKDWGCSGPIELIREQEFLPDSVHGFHVCDPCSWEGNGHSEAYLIIPTFQLGQDETINR